MKTYDQFLNEGKTIKVTPSIKKKIIKDIKIAAKHNDLDRDDFLNIVYWIEKYNEMPSKESIASLDSAASEIIYGIIYKHTSKVYVKDVYGVEML
jgi:hypothetical protein